MYRKKTTILWALTDPGIMIQNLETNTFLELNEIQERIWSYIDGTHTNEEILNRLKQDFRQTPAGDLGIVLGETITSLLHHELIIDN